MDKKSRKIALIMFIIMIGALILSTGVAFADDPAPPVLLSVTVTGTTEVELVFDKEMNDPSAEPGSFKITEDGGSRGPSSCQLKSSDDTVIVLTPSNSLRGGASINVSYTKGTVTSTDGGVLENFSELADNQIPHPVLPEVTFPEGEVGVPYEDSSLKDETVAGNSFSNLPSFPLPPGLTISEDGVISGTPDTEGTYDFMIIVYDSSYNYDRKHYSLTINPASGADTTPPEFAEGYPKEYMVYHPGSKHVSINVKPKDETVKAYYVIVDHGSTAPNKNEVMAGTDANGNEPLRKGTEEEVRTNGKAIVPGELPADDTVYDIYVVIQDTAGNASDPALLELRTPVKILADGYPKVGAAQAAGSKQVQILNRANGDCTAYWMAVANNGTPPLPGQLRQGMAGGYPSPIAAGSVELTTGVEAPVLIDLPADLTDYDVYVMLYKDYHGGSFIMGIMSGISMLDVKTPPASVQGAVCEIVGGNQYATLDGALAAVTTGQTIKLLANIDYDKIIEVDGKVLTFDLNGFDLNVATSSNSGLTVTNSGEVNLTGQGEFNVSGSFYGVFVDQGSATVTNATGVRYGSYAYGGEITVNGNSVATGTNNDDDWGAYAVNGGTITVSGDATGWDYGACADGNNSKVIVNGNVNGTTGSSSIGAYGLNGGRVEVTGDATGLWTGVFVKDNASAAIGGNVTGGDYGAYAFDFHGVITVEGNVTSDNYGAACRGSGQITIDGTISAPLYMSVGTSNKDQDGYEATTFKAGYREYKDGTNFVWVKVPSVAYNANDKDKLTAFANQESNLAILGWDLNVPGSWSGIEWEEVGGEIRCTGIGFQDKGLTGSLDVSGFTALQTLNCYDNELTGLVLTGDTALTSLFCNDNNLTTLDVSGKPALVYLYCGQNQLNTLTLSGNAALQQLDCGGNLLSDIDLSDAAALTQLYCWSNQIGSLDLSNNVLLEQLSCTGNELTSLDLSGLDKLNWLACFDNNDLAWVDISGTALTHLTCTNDLPLELIWGLNSRIGDLVTFEFSNCYFATAAEYQNAEQEVLDVIAMIDALLPIDDLVRGDAGAVLAARAAYDALSDVQKLFVTNYADLTAAEAKIALLPATPGGSSGGGHKSRNGNQDQVVTVTPEEPPLGSAMAIVLTPGSPTALVNGQEVILNAAPFINSETGRTMVPIRFVSEQLGAQVEWLKDTRQVKITLNDITIILTIGSNVVLVNGQAVEIDGPAELANGRTYVPLRFVSETLGATAEWDEISGKITISK